MLPQALHRISATQKRVPCEADALETGREEPPRSALDEGLIARSRAATPPVTFSNGLPHGSR